MDGTSDYIGEEMELFYIRIAGDGIVSDKFLALKTPKSSSSADLHILFNETLDEFFEGQAWRDKFVGFCADGAANMMGHVSGLGVRLRKLSPHLIILHCLRHRVELAVKDHIKKVTKDENDVSSIYKKVQTLLLGLYYLYRNSPKLKNGYKEACVASGLKVLLPKRAGGTRWITHVLAAINVILKNYVAFRRHLETASHDKSLTSAKAEGLAKLLSDFNVIGMAITMKVIECIRALSQYKDHTLHIWGFPLLR